MTEDDKSDLVAVIGRGGPDYVRLSESLRQGRWWQGLSFWGLILVPFLLTSVGALLWFSHRRLWLAAGAALALPMVLLAAARGTTEPAVPVYAAMTGVLPLLVLGRLMLLRHAESVIVEADRRGLEGGDRYDFLRSFQSGNGAVWVGALALLGIVLADLLPSERIHDEPLGLAPWPLTAALASLLPAILLTALAAAWCGRLRSDPLIWSAFGLGLLCCGLSGLASAPLGLLNFLTDDLSADLAIRAFLVAAVPEELAKFAVLLIVLRDPRVRGPADTVCLSVCVSLGFAGVENMLYGAVATDWAFTLVMRALITVPSHAADGLLMGACLVLARRAHGGGGFRWLLPLLVPVMSHGLFDLPLMNLSETPPDAGLLTVLGWSLLFAVVCIATVGGAFVLAIPTLGDVRPIGSRHWAAAGWAVLAATASGMIFAVMHDDQDFAMHAHEALGEVLMMPWLPVATAMAMLALSRRAVRSTP
ncbi:MAG TPA: PrsW family glutamic-type intramembrane protease [Alphaproteobacteria bacterium]|nr:PrsW family glutamic-type intramembrane protease [Alphaproteobacteria bacterium]